MRGKLIGHRIKYWRKDLNETTESQYLLSRSQKPRALIIGLQPNAYYWVKKYNLSKTENNKMGLKFIVLSRYILSYNPIGILGSCYGIQFSWAWTRIGKIP